MLHLWNGLTDGARHLRSVRFGGRTEGGRGGPGGGGREGSLSPNEALSMGERGGGGSLTRNPLNPKPKP